jgi:phosphosulfolactate synthase (CoM biosynthesis protein A)
MLTQTRQQPVAGDARPFAFLHMNLPHPKPRSTALTEIRGPYYTPLGPRQLEDLLDSMSAYVDSLKFAGGSFALMPRRVLLDILNLCHAHDVTVSTGGFMEYVMTQGPDAVDRYIGECRDLGFDTIEISTGFVTASTDTLLRLVEKVRAAGLNPKPEIGIQFGAGGATAAAELAAERTKDVGWAIHQARRLLDAGARIIMLESEGITESVPPGQWRTDVPARFAAELGLEKIMFEAADPEVFAWYIKTFGPDVNLFIDHSQIVQLQALRSGIWGTKSLWGRVVG